MFESSTSSHPPFKWEDVKRFGEQHKEGAEPSTEPDFWFSRETDMLTPDGSLDACIHNKLNVREGVEQSVRDAVFVYSTHWGPEETFVTQHLLIDSGSLDRCSGSLPRIVSAEFHIIKNLTCLSRTYCLCAENKTQAAMEEIFTRVHFLLGTKEYGLCDQLLAEFEDKRCPPIVAVGILRAAAPVRKALPQWGSLLARTKAALGEQAPRLLRGLL